MDSPLPGFLAQSEHIAQLDESLRQELAGIDIVSCMMMMVDTVSPAALPYLAKQFDVLGWRGYKLATTDAQKRSIIKKSIELKRYIGTVWAVKQAMIAIGYGGATLVEGAGTVGDGNDWARFRVVANLGLAPLDGTDTPVQLTNLINEYKNARSELLDISFTSSFGETLPLPTETIDVFYGEDVSDYLFTGGLKYDGSFKYDGSKKYKPGIEDVQITII